MFSFKKCNTCSQWKELINIISILWWNLSMKRQRRILIHALTSSTISARLSLRRANFQLILIKTKLSSQTKQVTAVWDSYTRTLLSASTRHWVSNTWKTISIKNIKINPKIAYTWTLNIPNKSLKVLKIKIEIEDFAKIWTSVATLQLRLVWLLNL